MKRLMTLAVLCSCATLDTSKMSDRCRTLYDSCLNTCSRDGAGDRAPPPPAMRPSQPPASVTQNASTGPQMDIAGCTDRCNTQAKSCERAARSATGTAVP